MCFGERVACASVSATVALFQALGGALAQPAKQYPEWFASDTAGNRSSTSGNIWEGAGVHAGDRLLLWC